MKLSQEFMDCFAEETKDKYFTEDGEIKDPTDKMWKMATIYKYTNLINGKVYVGRTRNWPQRQSGHRHNSNGCFPGDNTLDGAIQYWGFDNFKVEVLEECPVVLEKLREHYYIALFNSAETGYNINR